MTDDRSLERAARSWLEVGPTQAPDRAVEAALLRIETTPQERDSARPVEVAQDDHPCPRRRGRRHRRARGRRRPLRARHRRVPGLAAPASRPPRRPIADSPARPAGVADPPIRRRPTCDSVRGRGLRSGVCASDARPDAPRSRGRHDPHHVHRPGRLGRDSTPRSPIRSGWSERLAAPAGPWSDSRGSG